MAKQKGFKLLTTPANITPGMFTKVLAAASAAYSIKRDVPTVPEIAKFTNAMPASISKVLMTPEFKTVMRNRGFPFDNVVLTPEQQFAVSVITDPTNRKPLGYKLKQCGISYPVYRAWLKQPHFAAYITKISEDMLGEHVADVHTKVLERATGGDIQAIKLYYELTGRHDPQRQQLVDLNGVIGLLLEVITRYVTDTNALSKITSDIDLILSGGVPKALEQFDVSNIAIEDADIVEELEPIFDFDLEA